MRRIIFVIMAVFAGVGATAQLHDKFMEAGKYAYSDRNYPLASYFYDQVLRMVPEDSVVEVYIANARLRDIHRKTGQFDRAIANGRKCLDVLRGFGSNGRTNMMEDYAVMAELYAFSQDNANAACYLDSALRIVSEPDVNMAYRKKFSTLAGMVYARMNDWPMAESAYDLAVGFSQRYKESDDTQTVLNLYGNALYQNGKYDDAMKTYMKQRDVCGRLFGRDSREYQWANYCIANILAYMGRIDQGSALYQEVITWYRDKILHDLRSMPEQQREAYLSDMIDILQNAIPFGIEAKYNADEFTATAYENLLLSKGLLLATEKSTETIIRQHGSPEEVAALAELKELRTKLSDLLANPGSDSKDILNTYAAIKTMDVRLANACAGYDDNTAFSAVGYEQVRNSLKNGEVLLDFADFKPKGKPRQYVCYEVRKNLKYPKVHHICSEARLDSLLALEDHRWSNLYTGEAGDEMASMIGNPLRQIIGNAKTVFYVPSGMFHKLAIEAIPDGEVRLGDRYSFRRLSSGRELAVESPDGIAGDATLYGGLAYGPDVMELPRSGQEVSEIAGTLSGKIRTDLRTGNEGTKESFMALGGGSADVVHVSTHGFYYSLTDRNRPSSLQGYNDAMMLTGLVMSGGSLKTRNGLLTADEVSRCDLSNTSIACLATCHSGQGEVTSEGIYGLQRAFKKAGVKSVVTSLWEASDVAARCFMTNFYADLVNGSKDRHKAFRFARDEVRKRYPSPYYWAGFIMVD